MPIINGTFSSNSLLGTDLDDYLFGEDGNDALYAESGNDWLDGGNGADQLFGGLGNDTLVGGTGNNIYHYWFGDGNDLIVASGAPTRDAVFFYDIAQSELDFHIVGQDLLIEAPGVGSVTVQAWTTGNINLAVFTEDAVFQPIIGGNGQETLVGSPEADYVFGSTSDNTVLGDAGDDTLVGGTGNDSLYGGDGDDLIVAGNVADYESLLGSMGGWDFFGWGSSPVVDSHKGFLIQGADGNDSLQGTEQNDTLQGHDGNDHMDGGEGEDTLLGGAGNDTLVYDAADAVVDGGSGHDVLSASSFTAGVQIDLNLNSSIEEVVGGRGNSTLTGNALDNKLFGLDGNVDRLH